MLAHGSYVPVTDVKISREQYAALDNDAQAEADALLAAYAELK